MINLDPYLAVYFITFVALILLRVPIAYAMMASAFEYVVFNHQSFVMFAQKTANSLADFNMLALPAFLFVGCFMNEVGLTDRLFGMFEKWIGHLPGGLAHANVLSSMVFAGMSGSALADAGGLGTTRDAAPDAPFPRLSNWEESTILSALPVTKMRSPSQPEQAFPASILPLSASAP